MHFFALSLGKIFSHTWEFLLRLIVANEVLADVSDHRSSDASLPSKLRFVGHEITDICWIPYDYSSKWKCSYTIFAFAGPIISDRVGRSASRIFLTDLRAFKSSSRVLGPIPLISSISECKARLERLSRWNVMANRCTSS